ncbi:MAG: tRNA 2-thiocytidine(32) synthetase TtcA [Deltaproteobacteria bacterium]|jgi:tRNA 2-thiocytidine biosynthesis protein TtcA|nr:tRNA 2-thiocytidine(32) synthetase TtcA [Deltaproteobacteria bacterium]
MSGYAHKEIKRFMGKAIHKYSMTEAGDKILVSVSGGKDSMTLLWLMQERLARLPVKYEISAVHVDPGFETDNAGRLRAYFEEHGFSYRIITGDFGPRAHSPENLENPCFFCARHRRKHVFELAAELGCNKIALGHHKDDIIETLFLNMFYGGNMSAMLPVQDFFGGKIKLIRPFFMVDEQVIRRYAEEMGFPVIESCCPTSGRSKREEVKIMLSTLYKTNKKIKGNIFHALQNVKTEYLL